MGLRTTLFLIVILVCCIAISAAPPAPTAPTGSSTPKVSTYLDGIPFIDANKIFMFVTNFGNFGRDLYGVFRLDYGTFYPYIGQEYILSGELNASPLYAAGLWMGAIDSATGQTRVVISEYGVGEYVPGPMEAGTFLPDNPSFKVYKLYSDSLQSNPNQDYLNWPTDQGAPVDEYGRPLMRGHQTLWTVFNDADPEWHTNMFTMPLGVEVRLMAWAMDEPGIEVIPCPYELPVTQSGTTDVTVTVMVVDRASLTGHEYMVELDSNVSLGSVWRLEDKTEGFTVLVDRPIDAVDTVLGMVITVVSGTRTFTSFEVVANAAGPIIPPEPGALSLAGFPVPTEYDPDGYISERQQVTYPGGRWAFHTADDGGSCTPGTRGSYEAFLSRVVRNDNATRLVPYDYEMRFTGSYDDPGVGGSYAIEWFTDDNVFWVPFELWRTGIGTPDDPSDDIRLPMAIIDDYGVTWDGDDMYSLESWGCDATGSGDWEHSVSSANNDPFTDWVYWWLPTDQTPGQAGYDTCATSMLAGTFDGSLVDGEIMARTVLVSWNGGEQPPFVQDLPEQGTIFRLCTVKEVPRDTFTFAATVWPAMTTGDEGLCVYLEYWVHNKGDRTLKDCYVSLWADPDLGGAVDDFVGCDSLNNLFFCYNSDQYDTQYGGYPPAVGFKYLVGPLVPWPGETADFYGEPWPNHKNIGMTAFNKYIIGMDPENFIETYNFMKGLTKDGSSYVYDGHITTYVHSGDPVAGTGDLDIIPDDRRMMGSSGPFDFRPGDSLYMLVRMTAKHGDNYLDAITELKRVLNLPIDANIWTDVLDETRGQLPGKFAVSQNYPNPFNPSTTIQYSLPERAHVTIDVYNLLGQKIRQLVNETKAAGTHAVVWDGTDHEGAAVATGVYFYRVKAGDSIDNKKMLLLK